MASSLATLAYMRSNPPGTYMLIMRASGATRVCVGAAGVVDIDPGWYLYVGSALGGLWQRVTRHLTQEKRLRWHIDYLLQAMEIQEVWFRVGSERSECSWSRALATSSRFTAVGAIGASDCACRTHVYRCALPPDPAWLCDDLAFEGLQRWKPGSPLPGQETIGRGR